MTATVLTIEQVLALAPDASSAKAGQGLANQSKWVSLACDDHAAWGLCKGSGCEPYRTQVDLQGPAFKCSCPSRKFPCKHGLGLLLLLGTRPEAFERLAQPDWVSAWLEGRAKREEKRTTVAEEQEAKAPDPKAQAKRAAQREQKVARGLEELDRWLCDLVRQGLGGAPGHPRSHWEGMAARMVDAQASGVGRLVRALGVAAASGDGWQERLLARMGQLHLLIERYKKLESLPEPAQADIRALVGWSRTQEEVLAADGVADDWLVLGQRVAREDRLRVQRAWLWGARTGRAALLLQFAAGKEPLPVTAVPGTTLSTELAYYPGAYPLRALVKTEVAPQPSLTSFAPYATATEAYKAYVGALTKYPWLEQFPVALADIIPICRDGRWIIRDRDAAVLPLVPDYPLAWELLAISGGRPVTLVGEWDGAYLTPLGVIADGRFTALTITEE